MELVLWRHCEAAPGVPDAARPLTPRGVAQAKSMATWLVQHLPTNCRTLVSPALRAQQTAGALGRAFETTADVGTGTTVDTLSNHLVENNPGESSANRYRTPSDIIVSSPGGNNIDFARTESSGFNAPNAWRG